MEVEGKGEVAFQTKRDGIDYTIEYYRIKEASI